MKKIILLVASVLAAIQSIANRNVEGTNSNSLILSPSDGIYNHGSHASHASHASHYSMTITARVDSIDIVQNGKTQMIIKSLAVEHKVADTQVKIAHFYLSSSYRIAKGYNGRADENILKGKEKCLYVDYSISGFDVIREYSYNYHYGYIIPVSNNKSKVRFINYQSTSVEERNKTDWMKQLILMK
jgi:hypothetical protein